MEKDGNLVFSLGLLTGTKEQAVSNYSDPSGEWVDNAISKTVSIGDVQGTMISGKLNQITSVENRKNGSIVIFSVNNRTYLLVSYDGGNQELQNNFTTILSTFQSTQ